MADGGAGTGGTTGDGLPEWDLSDLYDGVDSAGLAADLAAAEERAAGFAEAYRGALAGLGGDGFGAAVAAYEAIQETLGRAMSYAELLYSGDLSDPRIGRFHQDVRERANDISARLLFFEIEINQLDDGALEGLMQGAAARYRPWVEAVRRFRPHQLGEETERLLHDQRVVTASWTRLFDEMTADMRFEVGGESLIQQRVLDRMSDPDEAVRRGAAEALGEGLARHRRTFALITNTLAKSKEIEDRWRRHGRPQSARNLSNQVEDEVVDALDASVREAYPLISHRYYRLKAGWLGKGALDHWDRNAPLPDVDERAIPWGEARDTVLSAYRGFSAEMAEVGARFFDNAWIDAGVREGKAAGAFAHPTVPSAHPYLLLNYQGKARDVMTLAHELGHGVHQVLAAGCGQLMADTPLTLAETASVFGETLTFRRLLDGERDVRRRKAMIASKVEDMINTVVRQIAFHNFERRVHDARREAELTADEICGIWLEVQGESLGPAVRLDGGYRWHWAYIPHFVHSPFYVYAYAFGDCLVNSLYAEYERAPDGFADRYLEMLRAGGTRRHRELLAPFGLDISRPEFWRRGLDVVRGLIDELEGMP